MEVVFLRHVQQQKIGQYHQRQKKKKKTKLKAADNIREIGQEQIIAFKYFKVNDNENIQYVRFVGWR